MHNPNVEGIAKSILDDPLLKKKITEILLQEVNEEITNLSRSDNYLNKVKDEKYFSTFKLQNVNNMLKDNAPNCTTFYQKLLLEIIIHRSFQTL